jgi:hypothetical protein
MVSQNAARAAEFKCVRPVGPFSEEVRKRYSADELPPPGTCTAILIRGEIVAGDADRFSETLRGKQPWIDTVFLVSPGGNMAEALSIGRLVRRNLLTTSAPVDIQGDGKGYMDFPWASCKGNRCICASACFFIWVAGVERDGNAIGLHRPYIVPDEARKLSLEEAEQAYGLLVDAVQAYLNEMDVPKKYFDQMIRTPSGNVVFLPWRQADKDFGGYIPGIAEWLKSRCGAMTPTEEHDFLEQDPSSVASLSVAEQHSYKALEQKYFGTMACENHELLRERIAAARQTN